MIVKKILNLFLPVGIIDKKDNSGKDLQLPFFPERNGVDGTEEGERVNRSIE